MCILCARPRKKSFQITTSLTSREMYSLLVFAIQSGESVKAPGMMLILKGMGINTCKIDSSSAIILFFFSQPLSLFQIILSFTFVIVS